MTKALVRGEKEQHIYNFIDMCYHERQHFIDHTELEQLQLRTVATDMTRRTLAINEVRFLYI